MSFPVIAEIEDVPVFRRVSFTARIVRRDYPSIALGFRIVARNPENPDDQQNVVWVFGSAWRYGFGLGFDRQIP